MRATRSRRKHAEVELEHCEKLTDELWMGAGQTRETLSARSCRCFEEAGGEKSEQETEQSAARAPILTICRGYLKIGMQRFVFSSSHVCPPPPAKKEGLSTYCFNDPAARITSYLLSVSQQPPRFAFPFLPDLQTSEGPFTDEMG